MKNFNKILTVIIICLFVVIFFKNEKIYKLQEKLRKMPKVEVLYNYQVDTLRDSVLVPYKVKILEYLTDTIEKQLTGKDSIEIYNYYKKLYKDYSSINYFDNILKDDSTGYIRLKEKAQYNSIFDRELIFEPRTPIIYKTETLPVYYSSVLIGVEVSEKQIEIAGGYIDKKNKVYKVSYGPTYKQVELGFYTPIITFNRK